MQVARHVVQKGAAGIWLLLLHTCAWWNSLTRGTFALIWLLQDAAVSSTSGADAAMPVTKDWMDWRDHVSPAQGVEAASASADMTVTDDLPLEQPHIDLPIGSNPRNQSMTASGPYATSAPPGEHIL